MAAPLQARPASTMQVCVWRQEGGLKFYRSYNVGLVWAEEMPLHSEWVMTRKARPRQRSLLDPQTGFVSYCHSYLTYNLWHKILLTRLWTYFFINSLWHLYATQISLFTVWTSVYENLRHDRLVFVDAPRASCIYHYIRLCRWGLRAHPADQIAFCTTWVKRPEMTVLLTTSYQVTLLTGDHLKTNKKSKWVFIDWTQSWLICLWLDCG